MLKAMRGGRRAITLTISSNQASLYNVFTAASSPTDPVAVLVVINSGVQLRAGLNTGSGWAIGTTITIENHGTIAGIGGSNSGGAFGAGGFTSSGTLSEGLAGRAGGDAVTMGWDLTIDNTDGFVLGGGGGGGGGGAASATNPPAAGLGGPGGGGGGGRGYNNAVGGDEGDDNGTTSTLPNPGSNGSSSAYGAGGSAGAAGHPLSGVYQGGAGGRGGDWGEAGQPGVTGSLQFGASGVIKPGGLGGAAGKAVAKNSKVLNWTGGNNSTQVKGAQT